MATNIEARDYSAPPRAEYEGRRFTAEITFLLAEEATDEQIIEWLEYEIGGGSIERANPLVENGAYPNRVTVDRLERSRVRVFTDWGPTSKDGHCSGKGRVEFDERGQ